MTLRIVTLLVLTGCGGRTDADLVRGRDGGICYPNGTCDPGWFCNQDDRCVTSSTQWCPFAGGELILNGTAAPAGNRLRLTPGNDNFELTSAYCAERVTITEFATEFTAHFPVSTADGMTFITHNDGPGALGSAGGGLGFAGVDFSVAVKLDLYDNEGEGDSSTGVYSNGALPHLPALDLAASGIDLHTAHEMRVRIRYAARNLDLTVTDLATNARFVHTFVIDLPAIVGDNLAWVGFTAATGGQMGRIEVFDWTFGPS